MIEILVAHIHDLKKCQKSTTSVSKCWCFRSERERDNLIPRALSRGYASECITLEPFGNYEGNYVVVLSCSEFGSKPKSRSLSTQSERVTHLHIENHHKNTFKKRVLKKGLKRASCEWRWRDSRQTTFRWCQELSSFIGANTEVDTCFPKRHFQSCFCIF